MKRSKNVGTGSLFLGCMFCCIGGMLITFFSGRKYEESVINKALNNMARYGSTMRNEVDGKLYECCVKEINDSLKD